MEDLTFYNGYANYDQKHSDSSEVKNIHEAKAGYPRVTSVEQLKTYAVGTIIQFPDFAEGQPFVARVRRPSLLVLAKCGKIPNALLNSATELFTKGGAGINSKNENALSDMFTICEVIAEAALIEPSYHEIKEAGIELTDEQLLALFNYTQTGVKSLDSFR